MIAAILISYVAVMFVFLRKQTIKYEQTNPEQALPLSVLIPFRGSVSELSGLLNDLNNQDYPLENVEVLIINDSEQPLHLATKSFRFSLQIIDSLARKGKKAAIDLGVSTAKNEHILSLDADVRLKATHLSGFSQAFAAGNDVVVGVLHYNELPKNFSNYFEYYEYYGMQAVTQASVLFGNSLLCSGANLGFTKATYVKTRAIRTDFELESGDDMFLLQAAKKLKLKIFLASGQSSSALLNYQTNLQAVLAQRIRWGAKSVVYKDVSVIAFTLLVAAAVWQYPALKAQAEAGSAYAARIGCSCRYVQGRPLDSCTTDFEPGMEIVSISDDPATRTVTGSVPLLASRSARFAGASGCLLVAE